MRIITEQNYGEIGRQIDTLTHGLQEAVAHGNASRTTLFVESKPYLDSLENLKRLIIDLRDDLPNYKAQQINLALQEVNAGLESLIDALRKRVPTRDGIGDDFQHRFEQLYEVATPTLAFLRSDVDPNVHKLKQLKTEQSTHAQSQLSSIQKVGTDALNSLRNEAAELIDKKFSSTFEKRAKRLARISWVWLTIAILSAMGAGSMIWFSMALSQNV